MFQVSLKGKDQLRRNQLHLRENEKSNKIKDF